MSSDKLIAEAHSHYVELNGLNSRAAEVLMELADALEAATRELDAALAAIERVRAIHRNAGPSQGYDSRFKGGYGMLGDCCGECGSHGEYGIEWPCPTVAALDGAPEPEGTEWVYRARNSILNSGAHVSEEAARATLQLMIENHSFEVEPEPVFIERRPRFAWLPVEGEKP